MNAAQMNAKADELCDQSRTEFESCLLDLDPDASLARDAKGNYSSFEVATAWIIWSKSEVGLLRRIVGTGLRDNYLDPLARYKPLCPYCTDGYRPQRFPNGSWGHDDVPEKPEYGSWPHGCEAGKALEAELRLMDERIGGSRR